MPCRMPFPGRLPGPPEGASPCVQGRCTLPLREKPAGRDRTELCGFAGEIPAIDSKRFHKMHGSVPSMGKALPIISTQTDVPANAETAERMSSQ